MKIASTCLEVVYVELVGVRDKKKRLRYQCDLLTRGVGGMEWASQLQCWSIYLLNCFASKGLSLDLICKPLFLDDQCDMWGGLMNQISPGGVGLLRILCHSKTGRKIISQSKHVMESLCNLSRSSDDWQYMVIDCLILLIKDPETRSGVMELAPLFLADLVEIKNLHGRTNVGDIITKSLLSDYRGSKPISIKDVYAERATKFVWDLKVRRRKREKRMSAEEVRERRVLVSLLKQEGNEKFRSGRIEEAILKYTEGLSVCPLKMRKDRLVLYSNRAQCHLLLKDADEAISDATRALSLSVPVNSHNKSLWRRSQAYDMKGLAKESLMDCIMFVNGWIKAKKIDKLPYCAVRMISKQMHATWLFAAAELNYSNKGEVHQSGGDHYGYRGFSDDEHEGAGLSTIGEQPRIRMNGSTLRIQAISSKFSQKKMPKV